MEFYETDGGRLASGFTGSTGDCVVSAIAIALEMDYATVYYDLYDANKEFASKRRCQVAKQLKKNASPRNGVFRDVYEPYLKSLGWEWIPTMAIGQGCKVHLRADELPKGRLVVAVSRHLTCVVDGVIHDTYDPSRNGSRCVYGYYQKPDVIKL